MIQNLYSEYEDSFCGRCKSYYNLRICPHRLFCGDRAAEITECCAFIEKHFTDGCKVEALCFPFKNDYRISNRAVHMVSLYLLGLKLKDLFEDSIKKEFKNNITGEKDWYDFKYTWFLTCLYHDTASCVEEKNADWTNNADLIISPYTTSIRCSDPGLSIKFRGSNALARNYFNYRKSDGKCEHGIIGGFLLFNRLIDSFQKATKDHDIEKGEIAKNGLQWRKEHIDHFRYIADAIICHNMWTVQSTDTDGVKKYKEHHLEKLIIDSKSSHDQRLSINDYPLQFMLCLLDTIEPTKRFSHLTAGSTLENVSIWSTDNHQLRIAWSNRLKQESQFPGWLKSIYGIKDWMQVDISMSRQMEEWCYVTVDFR